MRLKKGFDIQHEARRLMEMAIEEMRNSIMEPRDDDKAAPKVGAVLVAPDGTVEIAHRGELRYGDHAEFTLLERKNRDKKLDGSFLFATLEPCAPDARNHPKLGCAERISLARIKEVWVGIEDPDPKVDRKGIKHLQDAGIKVHMFDRDLQEIIRQENTEFIKQAVERANAPKVPDAGEITLSPLEKVGEAAVKDLSLEAIDIYRSAADISEGVLTDEFYQRLANQGLVEINDKSVTPTGFGILLFGKTPRDFMQQAGLLGTIHFEDGSEDIRNFDGPQVLVPDQAIQWLRDKLPNPIDRSDAHRKEVNTGIFEIVREGIVNALVHRDYAIEGAKCQLKITADKIEIWSPGFPVEPISIEQMQSFNAPMLSRNPVMHYVFSRMNLAEERGLGLLTMGTKAAQLGLPTPRYSWHPPYLILTVLRSAQASASILPQETLKALSSAEREGWQWVSTRSKTTSSEYAAAMHIPNRTALNHLKHFTELGLLERLGSGPTTSYRVVFSV